MIRYLLFPVRLFLLIILSRVNMKKLLILLFSILISFNSYGLFGWFEKTICSETDAQYIDGILTTSDGVEPFTGKDVCKYKNGQKWVEKNYKDGKLDGKWTEWDDNGQINSVANYKDGKLDGKSTWWNKKGQEVKQKNYKDGEYISGKVY